MLRAPDGPILAMTRHAIRPRMQSFSSEPSVALSVPDLIISSLVIFPSRLKAASICSALAPGLSSPMLEVSVVVTICMTFASCPGGSDFPFIAMRKSLLAASTARLPLAAWRISSRLASTPSTFFMAASAERNLQSPRRRMLPMQFEMISSASLSPPHRPMAMSMSPSTSALRSLGTWLKTIEAESFATSFAWAMAARISLFAALIAASTASLTINIRRAVSGLPLS